MFSSKKLKKKKHLRIEKNTVKEIEMINSHVKGRRYFTIDVVNIH